MSEHQLTHPKPSEKQTVLYGIGKAVRKVPEWHADRFMDIYDKLYRNTLSEDERAVLDRTRPMIEKRANALGWVVTGLEIAAIGIGIAKGYRLLADRGKQVEGAVTGQPALPVAEAVKPVNERVRQRLQVRTRKQKLSGGDANVRLMDARRRLKKYFRARPAGSPAEVNAEPVLLEKSDNMRVSARRWEGFAQVTGKVRATMPEKSPMPKKSGTSPSTPHTVSNEPPPAPAPVPDLEGTPDEVQQAFGPVVNFLSRSLRESDKGLSKSHGHIYRKAVEQTLRAVTQGKARGETLDEAFMMTCLGLLSDPRYADDRDDITERLLAHFSVHYREALKQ